MGETESSRPKSEQPTPASAERIAATLNIAPENRDHPVVREFVGFIDQMEQLQASLGDAAALGVGRSEAGTGERTPMPHEMDVRPSLRDRCSSIELFQRASSLIMRDGFAGETFIQDDPNKRNYLMAKLNAALGRYGLEVVPKVEPTPVDDNPASPRSRFKVVK